MIDNPQVKSFYLKFNKLDSEGLMDIVSSRQFFFRILLTILSISFCFTPLLGAALPAFPGAEGFGASTPGGRGGRVIKVTNLNTSGPGSLQAACSAQGPRIVVFDVSGVIPGDVRIQHGQVTIAGQTAPGAGITIEGMLLGPAYNQVQDTSYIEDVAVRFLRIRPKPGTSVPGKDWDAIQLGRIDKAVIDHVSCSWANDETIDIYVSRNVTIQWTTIEESDPTGHHKGQHNFGLIGGPRSWNVSLHHTLFANHRRRCPAFANGPADIRNIVVYNFRDGLSHEGHPPNNKGFNLIGNYYKAGPSDPNIFPFCFVDTISYYLRDIYIEGVGMIQDPWAEADKLYGLRYYAHKGRRAQLETSMPPVTTHSPQEAYSLVLDQAGCFPRDSVTRRTINEVKNGTGEWRRRHPGDLMVGLSPQTPLIDTDSDGMPDCWEQARGLDSNDGSDHSRVMDSGYTAIEEYCNILARRLIDTKGIIPNRGDVNGDGVKGAADLFALLVTWIRGSHSWVADMDIDGAVCFRDLLLWCDI
jgi:pectate lyase